MNKTSNKANNKTSAVKAKSKAKPETKSTRDFSLATCPVGGSGWCSFPFSPKQLTKRKPAKEEADKVLVTSKA
jgi:hypothetical protein